MEIKPPTVKFIGKVLSFTLTAMLAGYYARHSLLEWAPWDFALVLPLSIAVSCGWD